MAKTILAVAVGNPDNNVLIKNGADLSKPRPYITGLIEGLKASDQHIGRDYVIDYREVAQTFARDTFESAEVAAVFCMSTTVVEAAKELVKSAPVFAIVSEPDVHSLSGVANIGGISARRSQTAGECFVRFLATVPTLKVVRVLHKPEYRPSQRALELVKVAAAQRGVTVTVVPIKSRQDIEGEIKAMVRRDTSRPPDVGIQVLPVDYFFAAARDIIQWAQTERNIPTFWPATDWVPPALGGYGVPQVTCGKLVAEWIGPILKQQGGAPSGFKEAPPGAFEWKVSKAAAQALKIELPIIG